MLLPLQGAMPMGIRYEGVAPGYVLLAFQAGFAKSGIK